MVNGQKVWSSGARFSEWGELIARSDPDAVKHKGLTAFIIPMDLPGIEVRPIRQMSGGASFNEVFFTDVRVPDSMRLGGVGEGWRVALDHARLRARPFDRGADRPGRRQLGRSCSPRPGRWASPATRSSASRLATAYTHERIESYVNRRLADLVAAGATPGPEGSLGKLLWTNGMTLYSDVVSQILGPALDRRHRCVGHVRLESSTCSVPPATASPAAPTRSSATSSASTCSDCRPNRGSTRTSRGGDVPR